MVVLTAWAFWIIVGGCPTLKRIYVDHTACEVAVYDYRDTVEDAVAYCEEVDYSPDRLL